MNYVDQYLRLDERAETEETRAEEYKSKANEDRWEQCRIVHAAISEGGYTRRDFAEAVGRGASTISYQFRIWDKYGVHGGAQPRYADALAEMKGEPEAPADRTILRSMQQAKAIAKNPELALRLISDPLVARALMGNDHVRVKLMQTKHELDAQRAARVDRRQRERVPGFVEWGEQMEAENLLHRARRDINKALELLRGMPPLKAEARKSLSQEVEWLATSIEWLEETLKPQRSAGLSDEIEVFLAEQT
jgi:hypothetical protein